METRTVCESVDRPRMSPCPGTKESSIRVRTEVQARRMNIPLVRIPLLRPPLDDTSSRLIELNNMIRPSIRSNESPRRGIRMRVGDADQRFVACESGGKIQKLWAMVEDVSQWS